MSRVHSVSALIVRSSVVGDIAAAEAEVLRLPPPCAAAVTSVRECAPVPRDGRGSVQYCRGEFGLGARAPARGARAGVWSSVADATAGSHRKTQNRRRARRQNHAASFGRVSRALACLSMLRLRKCSAYISCHADQPRARPWLSKRRTPRLCRCSTRFSRSASNAAFFGRSGRLDSA